MSVEMKKSLTISMANMKALEQRLEELSAEGIKPAEKLSGELNISGCASGHCQGWA